MDWCPQMVVGHIYQDIANESTAGQVELQADAVNGYKEYNNSDNKGL